MHFYLNNDTDNITALNLGLELDGAALHDALVKLVDAIVKHDPDAVFTGHYDSHAVIRPAAGGDVRDRLQREFVVELAYWFADSGTDLSRAARKLLAALDAAKDRESDRA